MRGTSADGTAEATGAGAAGEPREGRLLRPAASCPRCGSRPALRATASLLRAVGGRPAGERMATYQCQRRGCGAVYDLCAGHLQHAG